jgi:hypothetical protein
LNIELMRAMGSPNGSDPIPPRQYLYFRDDSDPVQRLLAIIRSNAIRYGHRCHFATEDDGSATTMQNVADEGFSGNWANANRAWQNAEAQKLVIRDKEGRLLLCGNVPSRKAQRKSQEKQRDTDGPPLCTEWSKLCTEWAAPAYIREDLERRDEESRENFALRYRQHLKWADAVEADAIAAARREAEKREKLLFAEFGMARQQNGKKRDLKEMPLCVQLKLIAEPGSWPPPATRNITLSRPHSIFRRAKRTFGIPR